ncbi:MAG: hypothetical protein L3K26_15955 [Candidatus Hydrogenedentes bacterium]|nr:hypothetical protein [Candidatus Hydrogenedentota bacterium]
MHGIFRQRVLIGTVLLIAFGAGAQEDLRSFQHGIDFVPGAEGRWWLIWSSSGHPPTGPDDEGNWPHDVYRASIDPKAPAIAPELFIRRPEAQEPASAAATTDGNIMVTMEDGWNARNVLAQRYGVYDATLAPVRAYPRDVYDGGHSGHVAAAGNHFVVFYSDEWVSGGGVDDLGSGDDVLARVYDSKGSFLYPKRIAVGTETRDWWPEVAGSERVACLVWQRFVDGETHADLMVAMLDVETGRLFLKPTKLKGNLAYYTYSVAWLPLVERFLVLGAYDDGGGFGVLLDESGGVKAESRSLPPLVRESQSIVREDGNRVTVVQPSHPNGLMVLSVSSNAITVGKGIEDGYNWKYAGTDGIFLDRNNVYIVSLSSKGLVERKYRVE